MVKYQNFKSALSRINSDIGEQTRLEQDRSVRVKDAEAMREKCKSLSDFITEAWHVLEPNATFIQNWHIDAICDHLEQVTRGNITRLLINVPPGSMKSLIVSVFWPAWEWSLGMLSMRYLTTAFNDGPVKRDAVKFRRLVMSNWYQSLWPEVVMVQTGVFVMENSMTGARNGVAFGSLTSQRGDRLIIDDPHSVKTAESDAQRTETTRLFREGALNRLNDQAKSAIVVIMQRLHENDISGTILKMNMGYTHLMLPMRLEIERRCTTYIRGAPFFTDPRIEDGELLDPVRFPAVAVDKLEAEAGAFTWAGQYQQRPSPREGGLFRREWFLPVRALPAGRFKMVRGWDLAATEEKKAASITGPPYTASVKLAGTRDGLFVVMHAERARLAPMGVEALIKGTARRDGTATRISIPQDPGQAGKAQVAAFSRMLQGWDARFSPESGDKVSRADPVSAQAEAGNMRILVTGDEARDAWIEPFLAELAMFPGGAYKDQVDALSRAFAELLAFLKRDDEPDLGMPIQVGDGPIRY